MAVDQKLQISSLNWYAHRMSVDDVTTPETRHPSAPPGAAPDATPIARRKLSHQVLDRLLGRISSGEFPAGSLLPSERELMQVFGVGRPAVREALQALERMGLVAIVHGEGARLLTLSAESVIEQISESAMHLLSGSSDLLEHLKEARLQFEVAMARSAAARATPEQVEQLRLLLEVHRASLDDPARFLETDLAFHRGIAAMSGNPIYKALSQAMLHWLEQFHDEAVRAPGAEAITLAEHVKLFKRIAANDVEGAARAVTAHLRRANKRYGNQPLSPAQAASPTSPAGVTAPHPPAPATSRRRST